MCFISWFALTLYLVAFWVSIALEIALQVDVIFMGAFFIVVAMLAIAITIARYTHYIFK